MKQVKVFCTSNTKNQMDFFVSLPAETVYLFTVKYFSNPLFQMYKNGVVIENLFRKSKNSRIQTIQEHLIRNLKDLEKEYDISLFEKSKKWNRYSRAKQSHSITQVTRRATLQPDVA